MKKPSGCYGKVKHRTHAGAVIALHRVGNRLLNVYQCQNCSGWHLGSSSSPVRVQARFDRVMADHKKRIKVLENAD